MPTLEKCIGQDQTAFFIGLHLRHVSTLNRLLKNAHLRRSPHPSSLRRTFKYASLLRISGALHPGIFDQPARNNFFKRL
jgi:hypothetical protein